MWRRVSVSVSHFYFIFQVDVERAIHCNELVMEDLCYQVTSSSSLLGALEIGAIWCNWVKKNLEMGYNIWVFCKWQTYAEILVVETKHQIWLYFAKKISLIWKGQFRCQYQLISIAKFARTQVKIHLSVSRQSLQMSTKELWAKNACLQKVKQAK